MSSEYDCRAVLAGEIQAMILIGIREDNSVTL